MQIQFKGTNYEPGADMVDLATRKIETLEKYAGKTGSEPVAYVDMGKRSEAHLNSDDLWYADCNLDIEGKRYYAQTTAPTLRTALDRMVAELSKQVRRDHRKRHSLLKRSGARVKEFFRFSR